MHPFTRNSTKRLKVDEDPFSELKVSDHSILESIEERSLCSKCGKSRKYFCYICYIPVTNLEGKIPQLSLPIKIDIIKHKNEIDGKSTSAHAALLAPHDVKIFTYPSVPDYSSDERILLVYPSKNAKTVKEIFSENSKSLQNWDLPITRAVFIDSTWNQSKGIYKDERIQALPTIVLKNKISQFWRHQKGSPRWYLATIEAIYELLVEIDCEQRNQQKNNDPVLISNCSESAQYDGDLKSGYDGRYDNLLFFFSFMYSKIHTLYEHDTLLSYRRPLE